MLIHHGPPAAGQHKIHIGTFFVRRSKGLACYTLRKSRVDFLLGLHSSFVQASLHAEHLRWFLLSRVPPSEVEAWFSQHISLLCCIYIYVYVYYIYILSSIKNKKLYKNWSRWHVNMPSLFANPSLTIPLPARISYISLPRSHSSQSLHPMTWPLLSWELIYPLPGGTFESMIFLFLRWDMWSFTWRKQMIKKNSTARSLFWAQHGESRRENGGMSLKPLQTAKLSLCSITSPQQFLQPVEVVHLSSYLLFTRFHTFHTSKGL